jgi:hypothetical protein
MLPTKFLFIWLSGFRGVDILEINQSETKISDGKSSRRLWQGELNTIYLRMKIITNANQLKIIKSVSTSKI